MKDSSASPGEKSARQPTAKLWHTPVKHDSGESDSISSKRTFKTITRDIRLWATPLRTDSKFCLSTGKFTNVVSQAQSLSDGSTTNRLNPDWTETLMGWPVGWSSAAENKTLTFCGFPQGQGPTQYDYEPVRTVHKKQGLNRAKRIAMIGNGVCPQQVTLAYSHLFNHSQA